MFFIILITLSILLTLLIQLNKQNLFFNSFRMMNLLLVHSFLNQLKEMIIIHKICLIHFLLNILMLIQKKLKNNLTNTNIFLQRKKIALL